jgi:DNA-binding CsgD family transcriptional regulator
VTQEEQLREREKELDCLYQLAHLLTGYRGEAASLLPMVEKLLTQAMSSPEECRISLSLEGDQERLLLRIEEGKERLLPREVKLLESAVELTEETLRRVRFEEEVKAKNSALTEVIANIREAGDDQNQALRHSLYRSVFPMLRRIAVSVNDAQRRQVEMVCTSLEKLGSSSPDRFFPPLPKLTPRELEVSALVRTGADSKYIADALNISVETVERHRCTIRKKLGLAGSGISLKNYLINL